MLLALLSFHSCQLPLARDIANGWVLRTRCYYFRNSSMGGQASEYICVLRSVAAKEPHHSLPISMDIINGHRRRSSLCCTKKFQGQRDRSSRSLPALARGATVGPARQYKNFAGLATSFALLYAAKVDSPFPRLLGNLISVVFISVIDLPEEKLLLIDRIHFVGASD